MSLTITLFIAVAVLVVILFACANEGIKDKKEIAKLKNEIEKYKEQLLGYLKELEKSKSIEDRARIENIKELVTDAVEFENMHISALRFHIAEYHIVRRCKLR